MADTPACPTPRPTAPNDPTTWLPSPGAVTKPVDPTATSSTLPSDVSLKPSGLGRLSQLGNYKLLSPLGEGEMSIVYKAYHAGHDRLYALKVMQATPQMPGGPIERFLREARTLAKVGKHPNIVQIHDVGSEAGCYYLAMDLIEGGSLDRRIKDRPLPPREAALIARQVAEALHAAHQAGVIHCNLKPSNILLDAEGVPHVSDFGLARDQNAVVHLSQQGGVLGTPLSMAPEQIAGELQRIGPATDVYGLGATLYEMITGRPPFPGDTTHAIWLLATSTEPVRPSQICPAIPVDLETICLKAMRRLPEDRYATPREMEDDLDRFLRGEPVLARPIAVGARIARTMARHRAIILLSILIASTIFSWVCFRLLDARKASRGLERARALASERRWREARAAYLDVLALDPNNGEARAGLDRVDAGERREEADLAARQALEKARLVQGVVARWIPLAGTLREMERIAFTTKMSASDRREAALPHWRRIEDFIEATPKDPASQAVMRALAGWARVHAGYEDEGRSWMRQAGEIDPDLPYGAFVEALSWFGRYLALPPLPDVDSGVGSLRFREPHAESPEMRRIREEVDRLVDRAAGARVWGEGLAREFEGALAAVRAMQRGEYEEADRALGEAIASPTMEVFRTDLLLARGKARYLLKRFDGATQDFERVREVRSEWADAWYFVAAVHAAAGIGLTSEGKDGRAAFREAIEGFSQALARSPRHVAALLGRGKTRQMIDDLAGAIADYDAVIAIDPKEAVPYLNRGTIRFMRNELEEAERDYDAAIERNEACVEAWVGRGMTRARLGDPSGAVRAFDRALALAPDDLKARLERGDVERKCGDVEGAHADFEHAVASHPGSAIALVRRGYSWRDRGRYAEALADFEAAIALDPREEEAHAGRGGTLVELGRASEAMESLNAALELRPGHPEVLVNRSIAKQRLGDDAGALEDADAAVRAAPTFLHGVHRRAALRLARGDLEGAREDLERVIELAGPRARGGEIVEAHYNLACLYAQRSIGVERRGDERRAVELDRAEEWRGRAFECLSRAIELGFRDRAHLEKDPDLEPLRGRQEWKALIERLSR